MSPLWFVLGSDCNGSAAIGLELSAKDRGGSDVFFQLSEERCGHFSFPRKS
jgi:hypothetical protein